MKNLNQIFILGLIIFITFTSCKKKHDDNSIPQNPVNPQDQITYTLNDSARMPSKMGTLTNTIIDSNKVTLQYNGTTPHFSKGMIILDSIGQGYLRRVTSVQQNGNNVILSTSQAKIKDAFKNLYIQSLIHVKNNQQLKLIPGRKSFDTSFTYVKKGKRYRAHFKYANSSIQKNIYKDMKSFDWGFTLNNLTLEIHGNESDSSNLAFSLSCDAVTFYKNLDFDFHVDFDWLLKLKDIHLIKIEENSVSFENINITGNFSLSSDTSFRWLYYPVLAIIPVGPIAITVGFDCKLGFEAALSLSMTTTLHCAASYTENTREGFSWDATTGYQSIDEKTCTPSGQIDQTNFLSSSFSLSFSAGPFIQPELEVSLYGVLGPVFFAKISPATAELSFPPPACDIKAILELGMSLELTLFDLPVFTFSGTPWSYTYWSGCGNVTTDLGKPLLSAPPNHAINIPLLVTCDWSDVSNTTSYDLQVSLNPDLSNPVIDQQNLTDSQFIATTGTLQPNTKYYWRVMAKNLTQSSVWSDVWSFTTAGNTSQKIQPLAIGNYWRYQDNNYSAGTTDTSRVSIPNSRTITYNGNNYLVYDYQWAGSSSIWYLLNDATGCWIYGTPSSINPEYMAKYPAVPGDSWVSSYWLAPYTTTISVISTNENYSTPAGNFSCYVYHFTLTAALNSPPLLNPNSSIVPGNQNSPLTLYDYYLYFSPGVGYVGYTSKQGSTLEYKKALTSYHLN